MSRLGRPNSGCALHRAVAAALAVCAVAVWAASAFCSPATGSLHGFSINQVSGATVYFKRSSSDKAGVGALMLAGIGDELPDEAHCAHMAEHMVLMYPVSSGDSLWRLATADLAKGSLPSIGGHISLDSTEFGFAVPTKDLTKALTMLVESLFDNRVAPGAAYNTEMTRSRPELNVMTTGDLAAPLNRMRLNLLKGTPYDEKLFEADLANATPEKIRGFMRREYSPRRLTVVVIADCDEATVLKALRDCLGRYEPGKQPAQRAVKIMPPERDSLRLKEVSQPKVLVGVGFTGTAPEDYSSVLQLLVLLARDTWDREIAGLTPEPKLILVDATPSVSTLLFGFLADRGKNENDLSTLADSAVAALRESMKTLASQGPTDEALASGGSQVDPNLQKAIEALPQVYLEINQCIAVLTPGRLAPGDIVGAAPDQSEADIAGRVKAAAAEYLPSARVSVLLVSGETLRPVRANRPQWPYFAGAAAVGIAVWRFSRRKLSVPGESHDGSS